MAIRSNNHVINKTYSKERKHEREPSVKVSRPRNDLVGDCNLHFAEFLYDRLRSRYASKVKTTGFNGEYKSDMDIVVNESTCPNLSNTANEVKGWYTYPITPDMAKREIDSRFERLNLACPNHGKKKVLWIPMFTGTDELRKEMEERYLIIEYGYQLVPKEEYDSLPENKKVRRLPYCMKSIATAFNYVLRHYPCIRTSYLHLKDDTTDNCSLLDVSQLAFVSTYGVFVNRDYVLFVDYLTMMYENDLVW